MLPAEVLPTSLACTHFEGHAGFRSTACRVHEQRPNYRFVLRMDVKGRHSVFASTLSTSRYAMLHENIQVPGQ